MPVQTSITDCDTNPALNSPQGTETAKGNIDNYLRIAFSFLRQIYNSPLAGIGSAGATTAAEARTALGVPSTAEVTALVAEVISPGAVAYFAMSSAPTGWLKANGAAIAVATYAAVATAIYCGDANNATAAWGYRCTNPASPSTTRSTTGTYIVLPDLRGEFPRGWDDGRGVDSGRSLWSAQSHLLASHNHTASSSTDGDHTHGVNYGVPGGGKAVTQDSGIYGDPTGLNTTYAGNHGHTITVNSTGGAETRPRNIALLACIKY